MTSKKLANLLKTLEITLHSLHEEVREHNKDYFSDEGQEYQVNGIFSGEQTSKEEYDKH